MGNSRPERTRRVVLLLAPCILIISVILSVGKAYGRFFTALSGDNTVTVRPKDVAYVTGTDEWISSGNAHTATLTVGNTDGEEVVESDMTVRVRFFAPAEAGALSVILNADGKVYVATAHALNEKTPMYSERGEGNVYKFFSADGEELSLFLEGGQTTQYSMTVTVTGTDSTDGFRLDVENTKAN